MLPVPCPRQLLCLAPAAAVPCPRALPPIYAYDLRVRFTRTIYKLVLHIGVQSNGCMALQQLLEFGDAQADGMLDVAHEALRLHKAFLDLSRDDRVF